MKKTQKDLKAFLKEHDAEDQFYRNCGKVESAYGNGDRPGFNPEKPEEVIIDAFYWDASPEEHDFWDDLDIAWREVCEES